MKIWSLNPDGTYSLNLSNKNGPCTVTLQNDRVTLEYEVNGQPFEKSWTSLNEGEHPDVRQRLALIPILGFISNEETKAKMNINTIMTSPLSFDKSKAMIETLTSTCGANKELSPVVKEKIQEIRENISNLNNKLQQVIETTTTYFRTEIKFYKTIKHDIEEILETPAE